MADRKALIKKHETIISTLTKDIKKKKGAYKTAAEQKLTEAQAAYDAELAAFDSGAGSIAVAEEAPAAAEADKSDTKAATPSAEKPKGGSATEVPKAQIAKIDKKDTKKTDGPAKEKAAEPTAKVDKKDPPKAKAEAQEDQKAAAGDKKVKLDFDKKDLNGMSKKELEEECAKLSLGKKGSKEDLITRLMTFCLDNDRKEDDEEDDEEEDGGLMTEEEKKEAERLYKREQAIQKALRVLLKKKPDGVLISTVLEELSALGCKNFKPQLLNYESMEALLEDMPEFILDYQAGPPAKIFPSGSLLDI